jgi:hypothetical protein
VSYIFFWSFMVWNTHKRKNECKIFFHSSDMPRNSPHRLKLVKKPIKPCYGRRFLSKLHGASYFFTLVLVLNVYFSRIWWYIPLGVLKRPRKLPKMLKFCILGLFWPLWGYCSASGHTLKGFFLPESQIVYMNLLHRNNIWPPQHFLVCGRCFMYQ